MKAAPRITANEVVHRLVSMTTNLLMSRTAALSGANLDPEGRNLDKECGYPEVDPTLDQYRYMFERIGIATRVVNVYPSECFSVPPLVYKTEDPTEPLFEKAWKKLAFQHKPFHWMEKLDIEAGIGRFGVMLLGFRGKLETPAPNLDDRGNRTAQRLPKAEKDLEKLLYLRVFPEYLVTVKELEDDDNNPRFGQPRMYNIKMSDPRDTTSEENALTPGVIDRDVHWTRVIHFADNGRSAMAFGEPRLKPVYNYILDTRKISGGSSEMFYKGAFPGISFETFPELTAEAELDAESVKKEIEAYSNGLQRYMRLVGMTAKSLAPQVADPSNHLTTLLQLICATIQVPMPVFLGQVEGHMAGVQNSVSWNRRLRKRQDNVLTPLMIQPFIDRLMLVGVLPWVDEYHVEWRDLNVLSDTDKAKISLQKAQALLQYVTSGVFALVPPRIFLELVLQFTPLEAEAIIKAAGGEDKVIKTLKEFVSQEAGNTPASTGTKPEKQTGASGRRNGLGKRR